MLSRPALLAAALTLAAADAHPPANDRFAELVAAERRFAADARRIGINAAFRRHAAPNGVLLRPDPVPAAAALAKDKDVLGLTLEWSPQVAAVAVSGDLGVTSGPYRIRHGTSTMRGQFLTIWRRHHDGRWGWLIDHGLSPSLGDTDPHVRNVTRLAGEPPPRAAAERTIEDADARLNAAWMARGGAAIAAELAPDARVLRVGSDSLTAAAATALLASEAAAGEARRLGRHLSAAGDLGATFGAVRSQAGKDGHYVRVWRHGARGWKVLIDELVWL